MGCSEKRLTHISNTCVTVISEREARDIRAKKYWKYNGGKFSKFDEIYQPKFKFNKVNKSWVL